MENKSVPPPIHVSIDNRESLVKSGDYKPVLDKILYWYSNIYDINGAAVPEAFIGRIVGQSWNNLNNLTTQDNKSRSDKLATLLWDLIPGKEKIIATKDEYGIQLQTVKKEDLLSGTLKDVAINDRSMTNKLPRIWMVFNNGTLNWLVNSANDGDFDRFINEVYDGSLSPYFISKEEVLRVNEWVKSKGVGEHLTKPAIGVFIGAIKSGETYEAAIELVNSTFPKSEILNDYNGKVSPRYLISSISK